MRRAVPVGPAGIRVIRRQTCPFASARQTSHTRENEEHCVIAQCTLCESSQLRRPPEDLRLKRLQNPRIRILFCHWIVLRQVVLILR